MLNCYSIPPLLHAEGGEFTLDFATFRDGHAVLHSLVLGDEVDAVRFVSSLRNDLSLALHDIHSSD